MEYVVSGRNQYNCIGKDTVRLKTICTDGYIYIPTAFTPNRDGKNDVFTINGYGVRIINFLRIYNRWGEIIFEKKNFYPNDLSSAWTGKFKGVDAPTGAYVYFAEMECNAGEKFERKGTVTLVR
jgi:gliding motility-associated-like protein